MQFMKTGAAAAFAAVALMASGGAHAEGYVGLAGGVARADVDCSGTTVCDRNDTAVKVFGGYKFTPNIALEGNYFNFGKVKVAGPVPGFGTVTGDIKTSGFGIGAAFFGQFGSDWSGVARLGVASMKTKVNASVAGFSGSDSETKAQPYAGFGLGYGISKGVTLDLAADFSRGEYSGEKSDIAAFTVGMTFSF